MLKLISSRSQSKETLLDLNMKCWNSSHQGSRVIIGVVQVGAVEMYVTVEALRKNRREDEMQFGG
jgi:hypothetical protein